MEYGDPLNAQAAEKAFEIALQLRAAGTRNIRSAAAEAVARSYCVCVTEGEDAAERRLSNVHAELIDSLARRLRAYLANAEDG
jgi:hypothetical protein